MLETFNLVEVTAHAIRNTLNHGGFTSNSLEIRTQDGGKLLQNLASILDISQDEQHVLRFVEDFLDVLEIPAADRLGLLE